MRFLRLIGFVLFYVLLFAFLMRTFSFVPDKLADALKALSLKLGIK